MNISFYKDYDDCVKNIINLYSYALNVIKGNVIQVYYYIESKNKHSIISNRDIFLKNIAQPFNGVLTNEMGIYKEPNKFYRRDIDFIFENYINADGFCKILKNFKDYYIHHDGLWISGICNNITSLNEIIETQKAQINTICGELECKIKSVKFQPIQMEISSSHFDFTSSSSLCK